MRRPLLSLVACAVCASACAVGGEAEFFGSRSDASSLDATAPAPDEGVDVATDPPADSGGAADGRPEDTLVADTFAADTLVSDTFVADTFVADTFAPKDTAVADTFVADTFVAMDTFVADTIVSDTGPVACTGAPKLLINEVQLQDPASSTFKSAEFVELYNPNDCTVDLSAYKLAYKRSSADPSPVTRWDGSAAGKKLAAKGYYVIASSTFLGARNEDFASAYNMDEFLGGLALLNGTTTIDAVGWGTPSYVEGSPAIAPPMGTSLARQKTSGLPRDANNNSTDFASTLSITPGTSNL